MTVCVIYGSPHKEGNTARMLKEYVSGLGLKPDDDIRETDCYSLSASPCTDCGSCGQTGRCFMSDMDKLYADVEKCDLLIFASPVYNLSFPAPMKAVLDRFQVYFNRRFVMGVIPPVKKRKRAAILLSHDSDKYGGAEHAVTALKMICTVLNAEICEVRVDRAGDRTCPGSSRDTDGCR